MVDIITAEQAAAMVQDYDSIGFPNFFSVGIAYDCANALADRNVKHLTMYGNEVGLPGLGTGRLIRNRQVDKVIVSFLGTNPEAIDMILNGEMECEMYPQGTLIFKYWAGAAKMGGILTPVGVGTNIARGKEIVRRNGEDYIVEDPLRCRIAFVKAYAADQRGNVVFWKASANFNNMQARAADITIVEVDKIFPEDYTINYPDLPYYYVNALVPSSGKWKEDLRLYRRESINRDDPARVRIAKRAAEFLKDGDIVNLGIGIPLQIASFVPEDVTVDFMSENGIFGMGDLVNEEDQDPEINNAGREPVGWYPHTIFVDSFETFTMVGGGRLDKTFLGTHQVDEWGNFANYEIPGEKMPGVGGGMNLAHGAKEVIICTKHTHKGEPKIVKRCEYPLTGVRNVKWIVTDLAVFKVTEEGLLLAEVAHDSSLHEIRAKTDANFRTMDGFYKTFGE
jgi:3-oxoacid CoA-transferase